MFFLSTATKGFRTAMFIIFLGIIPAAAIVMFLFYYTRRNIKLTSIKSSAPYVENSVSPCVQHVISACKGVGTVFSKKRPPVPSVSQKISNRTIEIMPTGLISTTNTEAINRSNTIGKRPESASRMSLKNIKGLRLNTNIFNKVQNGVEATGSKTETSVCVKELAKQFVQPKI